MKVIKLVPNFPFHFRVGAGRTDKVEDMIHSDTLFSAIINCASLLYPPNEVNSLINAFTDGTIGISSVYYGINTPKGELLFFPKPSGKFKEDENDKNKENISSKKIKKIKYISYDIWKNLIASWNGKEFNFDLSEYKVVDGEFLISDEFANIFTHNFKESNTLPKVQVNRRNNQSENLYFQIEVELVPTKNVKPFMFFLYRGEIDAKIKAILNLLIEEGLGGERFLGKGIFKEWQAEDIDLPEPVEDGYNVSLSLVIPKKEETKGDNIISYNLIRRVGFIYANGGTPYRKKGVRLLTEGSIFSKNLKGTLLDVKPEFSKIGHPVYINGLSFNIKLGGKI